ncbi:MAG TPA: VOC family protein [Chloroflexota bacterium]|jgi:hypothetical protein
MEQRLSVVTLGVTDLARSRAFYVDGLGWQAGFENDEIVFYQCNGIVFGTWLRDRLVADAQLSEQPVPGAMSIAHNVRTREEVQPLLAGAAAAGGRILRPAQDTEYGGFAGYVADPDGHVWEIAWNPSWPIGADGSITLGI